MIIPQRKDDKPKTVKQKIAEYRENIPDLYNGAYRKVYDKAMSGKSLLAAAKAKCNDCMCWEGAEVTKCDIVQCPLWLYVPARRQSAPRRIAESSAVKKE